MAAPSRQTESTESLAAEAPASDSANGVGMTDDIQRQRAALLDDALDLPLPPMRRRGRGRVVLLFGAGLIFTVLLGLVVLNIDRGMSNTRQSQVIDPNAPPPPVGIGDATPLNQMKGLPDVASQRGWIQATENGRLAQEYRYAQSEPAAAGRLHLTKPEVKVYMRDQRVLTLRGETADVHAPTKAIESGIMDGSVVIRLYEVPAERQLDEAIDAPLMEVHTDHASYDNFQGEVRCPGWVDIQTPTAHLPAIGLRMQINDLEGRPGQLTIDRINGELRLAESIQQQQDQPRPPSRSTAAAAGEAEKPAATRPQESSVAIAEAPTAAPRADDRSATPGDRAQQRQRDRARERREARLPAPAPIEKNKGPFFYRLTLNQSVRIRQGDGSHGWTATGDQLHMIFSLDNKDLGAVKPAGTATTMRRGPAGAPLPAPMPLDATLASLAIGSVQDQSTSWEGAGLFKPADTDTIVTCEGPLTMVPLVNAAEQPRSPDDSRFELIGSPVVLHNHDDQTNITCSMLQYASLSQVLELISSVQYRLIIDSPELHAECHDRLWVDRLHSDGAFEGDGWMLAGEERAAPGTATQPALPVDRRGDVHIAWSDSVDLNFEQIAGSSRNATSAPAGEHARPNPTSHDSFGRLRLAMFNGDVAVESPDFTLNADRMGVGFPARDAMASATSAPSEAAQSQPAASQPAAQRIAGIEFIHAERNVFAGSLSDGGTITTDDLRVDFTNRDGQTMPGNMLAKGNVVAIDRDKQTVWSDQLNVSFKPIARVSAEQPATTAPADSSTVATPTSQPAASQPASRPDAVRARRRADVDMLTATGAVQILMSDGARVFADRLEADGEGHRILLTGQDLMVVSDRSIIHGGSRLELTERGEHVTWPGAGEFTYYTTAVLVPPAPGEAHPQHMARPSVDLNANPRQMLATWTDSMLYDATYGNGAGSITVLGHVNAESTPSAIERNTMTGSKLTLLFAKTETAATAPAATMPVPDIAPATTTPATTGPASRPESMFAMNQRGRQLRQMIAEGSGQTGGDARLESRTWVNADHSDRPRVFYLAGQLVTYDDQTLEATVPVGGMLVIRDERVAPATTQVDATQPAASAPATAPALVAGAQSQSARKAEIPFGGKGTTSFKWTKDLHMTRRDKASSLYDITMIGGIEVRHQALDQSLSTMTGERLEATVDRSASKVQRDTGFDLGGSMDLQRIHALDSVYVHSPTRDVECDDFDYDYASGIAKLNAREGRVVTLLTTGNPHPVQARSFIWNTVEDTVQASGVSGSSGR